jgi:hypothetical protein
VLIEMKLTINAFSAGFCLSFVGFKDRATCRIMYSRNWVQLCGVSMEVGKKGGRFLATFLSPKIVFNSAQCNHVSS